MIYVSYRRRFDIYRKDQKQQRIQLAGLLQNIIGSQRAGAVRWHAPGRRARMSLSTLGRKAFVSQSALSKLLQELKNLPKLPDATSRSAIKRAREEAVDLQTPVGSMFGSVRLRCRDDTELELRALNPVAWLYHIASVCDGWASWMDFQLQANAPTRARPWELVLYSDEVTPGNQLKPDNRRKYHAIYFTFKCLGMSCLTDEVAWWTLAVIRSHLLMKVDGGLSALMRCLLETFYKAPHDLSQGVLLKCPTARRMLFAKVTTLIGDESALKQTWSIKGASGTLPCLQLGRAWMGCVCRLLPS